MRILFIVRGEPDLERFCAIALHLKTETIVFADVGDVLRGSTTLHQAFLTRLGHELQPWYSLSKRDVTPTGGLDLAEARRLLDAVRPDLVVLDQFGPGATPAIVACRDAALTMEVTSCMIPHGVEVVRPPRLPMRRNLSGREAHAVFFTSATHKAEAGWFLARPGTWWAILGDPRFDRTYITALQATAQQEGHDLTPLGPSSVAYFGSRLSPDLSERLAKLGVYDPERTLIGFLKERCAFVLERPHPRLEHSCLASRQECIVLSTRAGIVSALASSSVLEGLVLGKPAIILDAGWLGRRWASSFGTSVSFGWAGQMPLRLVEPNAELLSALAWGGDPSGNVAANYASCLRALARGDPSTHLLLA